MTKIFDKDFFNQLLLICIGTNITKQTFKAPQLRCGRRSNMKMREIENNGGFCIKWLKKYICLLYLRLRFMKLGIFTINIYLY